MTPKARLRQLRACYRKLLRLYPKSFRQRFAEPMAQTFDDLLKAHAKTGQGLFGIAAWVFVETLGGLVKEHMAALRKSTIYIALATALLLSVPLIAMQFTDEVVWTAVDFIVAGCLLLGAGLGFRSLTSKAGNIAHRAAAGIAVGSALLLVWVNLAVGIIGHEANPANLMYVGVLAVGFIGARIARFQPRGMANALLTTALAQLLVGAIAVAAQLGSQGQSWPFDVVGATALFTLLWSGSALLFRHVDTTRPTPSTVQ